jgi:hypothetical protein
LLRTEALRAGSRLGNKSNIIEDALDTVSLILPTSTTFLVAGQLLPATLCLLDALHLAAAMEIGDDLEGMVAYGRLIQAALAISVNVLSPQ